MMGRLSQVCAADFRLRSTELELCGANVNHVKAMAVLEQLLTH